MDEQIRPIKPTKPLGYKSYGSIPHLPGSRLGEGDHHCHAGQAHIATVKTRDKHDIVIVQEKLDGSNCSVAKLNGEILALGRSGYLAESSDYEQHQLFAKWVRQEQYRFDELLQEGERVCGEWLAQAHGTKYNLTHEPFVPFDLMTKSVRANYAAFKERVTCFDFAIPTVLHIGSAVSVEAALEGLGLYGFHGAIDEVEGAVWRVERKGVVDFLAKFVKHSKVDGKYLPENNNGECVWNICQ